MKNLEWLTNKRLSIIALGSFISIFFLDVITPIPAIVAFVSFIFCTYRITLKKGKLLLWIVAGSGAQTLVVVKAYADGVELSEQSYIGVLIFISISLYAAVRVFFVKDEAVNKSKTVI